MLQADVSRTIQGWLAVWHLPDRRSSPRPKPSKKSGFQMIRIQVEIREGPIAKLCCFCLLVIGLAESEALAQISGTWAISGNLNTGRLGHMATLLPNDYAGVTPPEVRALAALNYMTCQRYVDHHG